MNTTFLDLLANLKTQLCLFKWETFLVPLFGSGFGAWFAFLLNERREKNKEIKSNNFYHNLLTSYLINKTEILFKLIDKNITIKMDEQKQILDKIKEIENTPEKNTSAIFDIIINESWKEISIPKIDIFDPKLIMFILSQDSNLHALIIKTLSELQTINKDIENYNTYVKESFEKYLGIKFNNNPDYLQNKLSVLNIKIQNISLKAYSNLLIIHSIINSLVLLGQDYYKKGMIIVPKSSEEYNLFFNSIKDKCIDNEEHNNLIEKGTYKKRSFIQKYLPSLYRYFYILQNKFNKDS